MLELLTIAIFIWLMVKAISLLFEVTWGIAKITASILIGLALPALIVCFIFVGGIALMVPLIMIAITVGISEL